MTNATDCIQYLVDIAEDTKLFTDNSGKQKVFRLEDAGHLKDISAKVNYPCCGVVYEGIHPASTEVYDFGTGVVVRVAYLMLVDSTVRYANSNIDYVAINTILDTLRGAMLRKVAPTNHNWGFGGEYPMDLGKKGLAYYQSWYTPGTL